MRLSRKMSYFLLVIWIFGKRFQQLNQFKPVKTTKLLKPQSFSNFLDALASKAFECYATVPIHGPTADAFQVLFIPVIPTLFPLHFSQQAFTVISCPYGITVFKIVIWGGKSAVL